MKLGDLFWIKLYKYKKGDYRYDDTLNIMRVIKEKFDIQLTFLEVLCIWEYISNCRDAGWLVVDSDEDIIEKLGWIFEDYDD